MPEAVIVSAARSPIGRAFKGSLKDLRPDVLAEPSGGGFDLDMGDAGDDLDGDFTRRGAA